MRLRILQAVLLGDAGFSQCMVHGYFLGIQAGRPSPRGLWDSVVPKGYMVGGYISSRDMGWYKKKGIELTLGHHSKEVN